jgi:hypothetical protein
MTTTYLESRAAQLGLRVLVESSQVSLGDTGVTIERCEPGVLTEGTQGKYQALAIVRNVPFTRFTRNRNGRTYLRELWQRVLETIEGSLSFCDHPLENTNYHPHSGDGSMERICGVFHNARLGEECGYVDWYLVGPIGKLILETLQAGAKGVGLSTVGFGQIKENYYDANGFILEGVVDPETFIYERTDCVFQPSQGVFATIANLGENTGFRENQNTNDRSTSKSEARNSNNMDQVKLLEGNAKYQTSERVKLANKALKSGDLQELTERFEDLKGFAVVVESMPAERQKIAEAREQLEAAISEAALKGQDAQVALQGTAKKLALAEQMLVEARKANKQMVAVIERLGGTPETLDKLKVVDDMAESIETFKANEAKYKLNEKIKDADLQIYEKEINKISKDNKVYEGENRELVADNEFLVKQLEARDGDIKKSLKDRMVMEGDVLKLVASVTNLTEDLAVAEESIAILRNRLREAGLEDDPYAEVIGAPRAVNPRFPQENSEGKGQETASPAMRRQASSRGYTMGERANSASRKAPAEGIKESVVRNEIRSFYEQKAAEYPALQRHRDAVLNSKTLFEAVRVVEAMTRNGEDPVIRASEDSGTSFTESSRAANRPSWLRDRL